MAELHDEGFPPSAIPADAVVVLAYDRDSYPTPWRFVCMATGYATPAEVAQAVKDAHPEMNGQTMLGAQVGGNKARVKTMAITTTISRTLAESDPAAS